MNWPWLSPRPELRLRVTIIVEPDGDGFHAYAPGLKGLHTDGRTEAEALEHARDAVRAYLASLAKHDDPLPVGPDLTVQPADQRFTVPVGAFLRHVELQWPSLQPSGSS